MILFDQNIFEKIYNKTTKIFLWSIKNIFDWNQDWPQIGQFGPLCIDTNDDDDIDTDDDDDTDEDDEINNDDINIEDDIGDRQWSGQWQWWGCWWWRVVESSTSIVFLNDFHRLSYPNSRDAIASKNNYKSDFICDHYFYSFIDIF